MKGIGGHQLPVMQKDEWLTPPWLLEKLGQFDLDPCSPGDRRPWDTAKAHYSLPDDGLSLPWEGRVWCNPPYGLEATKWLKRCYEHGNATALIFARTETKMFFDYVWDKAHSILFIKGRLFFHHVNGEQAKANSGAPSVLISYDQDNTNFLKASDISGKLIILRNENK